MRQVALPDPSKQPLSVRLSQIAGVTELDVFLAALLISTAVPIAFFLVFQRLIVRGVSRVPSRDEGAAPLRAHNWGGRDRMPSRFRSVDGDSQC